MGFFDNPIVSIANMAGLGPGLAQAATGASDSTMAGGLAAAGGIGIGGAAALPLLGGVGNYLGQKEANEINIQLGREQMAFQERMSSSAHQREVKDLIAAGLNPLLSANAGASSPAGAMPQVQNAMQGLSASAMETANLMMGLRKQKAELALMKAQTDKTNVDAAVAKKGIPASELTNDVYDIIRPAVKKIKEATTSSAKESPFAVKGYNPKTKSFNLTKP